MKYRIALLLFMLVAACASPAPSQLAQVVQPTQAITQPCVTIGTYRDSVIQGCSVTYLTDTPTATQTETGTPTGTGTATASNTPAPTNTATNAAPTSTSTAIPGSPTPSPIPAATDTPAPVVTVAAALPAVNPLILGTCPPSVHDRYVVTGPDGKLYRTWHPQVVPLDPNVTNGPTCTFAHEHGQNPQLSLANPSLPPFNYIASLAGMSEPHEGFKCFVAPIGEINVPDSNMSLADLRACVHTGSGGVGRYDQQMHSFTFDGIWADGHYVHLSGMADTGTVGSICERNDGLHPTVGRTVLVLPALCPLQSKYEIWAFKFQVGGNFPGTKVRIQENPALFDPILTMDPADHRAVHYTTDLFKNGPFHGCDRENYFGPVDFSNQGGATSYLTDAFGNLTVTGPLLQQISNGANAVGLPISTDPHDVQQYKSTTGRADCAPGLGLLN
jgi:hypothetical protein